ncbi:MAG: beta-N-acetylhexosaminidase [Fervidobacterium sp.]
MREAKVPGDVFLIPYPKILVKKNGKCVLKSNNWIYSQNDRLGLTILKELKRYGLEYRYGKYDATQVKGQVQNGDIILEVNEYVMPRKEGFKIFIGDSIQVFAHDEAGLFYAFQTLKQLIRQFGNQLPKMYIKDYPDFPNRGVMLDISRDRIPRMETLKYVVDKLSELRFNQLQLYMEHTFAYKNHKKVWEEYSPLTHEEIVELDNYCRERHVELVPNQNTFGHLSKWLIHEEYKYLAEAPDGYETPWGFRYEYPFSLSPAVEESTKFIQELLDELLPLFSSSQVNIGCDETLDLGVGKSKQLCERYGKGKVYYDFLMKIYSIAKKHKRAVMFWGDIIESHPEFIPILPKDMISMVWGYEADHPFDEKCKLFADSGIPFYVCPGTSTWNTFIGRSDNAIENIKNAIINGKKYGAIGVLLTDWGDNGHPQHLPLSWIGFSYAALLSWNSQIEDTDIGWFLKSVNVNIFETSVPLAELIYRLGSLHNQLFYAPNGTPFFYAFLYPERFSTKNIDIEKLKQVSSELDEIISNLKQNENHIPNIIRQLINNIDFARLGLNVMEFLAVYKDIQAVPQLEWSSFEERLNEVLEYYRQIWLEQNRVGGLKQSIEKLTRILRVRQGDKRGLIF